MPPENRKSAGVPSNPPSGGLDRAQSHPWGLAHDVTACGEPAAAETTQQASEARFRQLFETLQEGIYFSTPDGRLLDANPALVRMLGYESTEELCRVNFNDLYADPEARPQVLAELEENASRRSREITLRRKDGSPVICLDTSLAIRDAAGQIVRYQGTLVDITQRREIERRLQRQQEFARSLIQSFPDLIVVLDSEGRYTYVSPRITELLGYTAEELVGRPLGERSRAEDGERMLGLYRELLGGQKRLGTVEYRTMHKDGSWRIFRATASPLYDVQGKIIGVVASARDVTEVKRLEEQVLQTEKLAAMGQMIAGVAHELNNPLTAILGVSDLLRERAADDSSRRQLDLVHQQARRAAHIVQNLLAYSRPPAWFDSAYHKPSRGQLNLAELVERTVRLQEYSLRSSQIRVEFERTEGLSIIEGDPNQLTQVFLNLLVNAEQAIRSVRDRGVVRVRTGQQNGQVWVSVEDDGPGIPPEVMPKIYDPFFTTKRPGRGTGLGLSICLAVVREHQGKIEAANRPGGGARFTVTFRAVEARARSPEAEEAAPAADFAGQRVLVVDDEASILELVAEGLGARGIQVECVASAEDALRSIAGDTFDAVICDWNLSGLDGRQFLARVQDSAGQAAPALILTTGDLVDPEMGEELERRGVVLLEKPFRMAQLLVALGRALEAVKVRVRT